MSYPIANLPNTGMSGGAMRVARKACVIHFICGDSLGAGHGAGISTPSGIAPAGAYVWGQNTVDTYPGNRYAQTPTAGVGLMPYGTGHGAINSPTVVGSQSVGKMIAPSLVAKTTPKGGGPWSGPDHIFVDCCITSATMSPTGVSDAVSFYPGLTHPSQVGNAFVDAHSVGALTAIPRLYPGGVYLGALTAVSFAGDATDPETGSGAAFTTNFTAFVNDFRTNTGTTSATLPVYLCRTPTVSSGEAANYPELTALRTAQDNSDGSNGITTIDIDAAPWGADGVHRTAAGTSIIASLVANEYAGRSSFARWTGF